MNTQDIRQTAEALMANDKGLLAMDESTPSINARFDAAGIPATMEFRRAYRELIVTAPSIGEYLAGAILFDETVHQQTKNGIPFITALEEAGVIPGIKVDEGTVPLAGSPGETITQGLDTLRQRLASYRKFGLRFAKWRAVFHISESLPTDGAIYANCYALARYAALCQEAAIVPIVEPEVLMDGTHGLITSFTVTKRVLKNLIDELSDQRLDLSGMILKPNMIIPGLQAEKQETPGDIAKATVHCLIESVPGDMAGIAFLSGGQAPALATARLNAMHQQIYEPLPWPLTFSFSRAIQKPALEFWKGRTENVVFAQQLLINRLRLNALARQGAYTSSMEESPA